MQESQKDKKDETLADEQKERDYYYDDAHGYEQYDPEEDGTDAEEDMEKGRRGDGENS